MNTRAKFTCNSVTKSKNWDQSKSKYLYTAEFTVVQSGSEENKNFFASTPSGSIKISSYAEDLFEPGKEYFIDFSECAIAKSTT